MSDASIPVSDDELALWRDGKQMLAIRAYRERTGALLHDARAALYAATGEKIPPAPPSEWPPRGWKGPGR